MDFTYRRNLSDFNLNVAERNDIQHVVMADVCQKIAEYLMTRRDLITVTIDDRGNVYAKLVTDNIFDQSRLSALTYNNTEAIKSILQGIKDQIRVIGVDLAKSADKTGAAPKKSKTIRIEDYPDYESYHEAQKQSIIDEMLNSSPFPPKKNELILPIDDVSASIDTDIFESGGHQRPVSEEDKEKLNKLFGCGAGKPGA